MHIAPRSLDQALDYLRASSGRDGIDKLVILSAGACIYAGPRADETHGVWSATKSFVSTILGLLVDDGKLSLDQPVCTVVPELKATYATMTFRHLATMTSGYRAAGDEISQGGYRHGPSATWYMPSPAPLFAPPGSTYAYWDSAMNLFGYALTCVLGEPVVDFLRRRIADPLETRVEWPTMDHGPIPVCGGAGNLDKHIHLSARDLAKFGQLYLQRGVWNGRRLISESWCRAATTVQVPASVPLLGYIPDGPGHYGLNWWVNAAEAQAKPKWPGAPWDTFSASGYNNNDLFILPQQQVVVARLGLDQQTDGAISDETYGRFLQFLVG